MRLPLFFLVDLEGFQAVVFHLTSRVEPAGLNLFQGLLTANRITAAWLADERHSFGKGKQIMRIVMVVACSMLFAGGAWAQPISEKKPVTLAALKAEIEALKVAKVAWREIAWKSCLLEGLKESCAKKKPVLLWIFIDRPVDDARC